MIDDIRLSGLGVMCITVCFCRPTVVLTVVMRDYDQLCAELLSVRLHRPRYVI